MSGTIERDAERSPSVWRLSRAAPPATNITKPNMMTTNGHRWLGWNARAPAMVAAIAETVRSTNVYCDAPPSRPVACAHIHAPPIAAKSHG